jgi:hypothetical protein
VVKAIDCKFIVKNVVGSNPTLINIFFIEKLKMILKKYIKKLNFFWMLYFFKIGALTSKPFSFIARI